MMKLDCILAGMMVLAGSLLMLFGIMVTTVSYLVGLTFVFVGFVTLWHFEEVLVDLNEINLEVID